MKIFATSLLVVAAVLYVVARLFESVHPAVGYLRAFCEAAMVGGLADWFAVTALFRHPLGVPLPHTAIIVSNQERIADALARFVEFNFLSTEVVTEKLAQVDFAMLAGHWMADRERSGPALAKIVDFLPRVFAMAGAEPLRQFARDHDSASLKDMDLAPLAAQILGALSSPAISAALVDEILRLAGHRFGESTEDIRTRLSAHTAPLVARLDIDAAKAEQFVAVAADALATLHAEPQHVLRERLSAALRSGLEQWRTSADFSARIEDLKLAVLENPAWAGYLQQRWEQIGRTLREDIARPTSTFRAAVQSTVSGLGEGLVNNMMVRYFLNMQIRQMLVSAVERHRHHAAALIAETMRKWDATTMSGRIEDAVGRDLQYIRINGTVIGGLVGVIIHAISTLAFH